MAASCGGRFTSLDGFNAFVFPSICQRYFTVNTNLLTLVTNTYLRKIKTIVGAESILNASWFEPDSLVEKYEGRSSYWDELQICAPLIGELYLKAMYGGQ